MVVTSFLELNGSSELLEEFGGFLSGGWPNDVVTVISLNVKPLSSESSFARHIWQTLSELVPNARSPHLDLRLVRIVGRLDITVAS